MPQIPINNVGALGLISDISGDRLPPHTWSQVKNWDFRDGHAEVSKGYNEILPRANHGKVEAMRELKAPNGDRYICYAGGTDIFAANAAAHEPLNAAPLTGPNADEVYSILSFHGIPVFNSPNDVAQTWDFNPVNNAVNMAGLNTNFRFQRMVSFKNFLIGLGFRDLTIPSAEWNYKALVWSHSADPGTLPSSWDYTDPALDAGLTELGETDDNIVDGFALGERMIIYKEDTTWAMTYTGGQFIFRFDRVFDDLGLLAPNCVASFSTPRGNAHLVVTKSDIRWHNGMTHDSILDRRLRRQFNNDLSRANAKWTFVLHYQYRNEIWIFYPDETAVNGCNRVMVWNYVDNTITEKQTPEVRAGCRAVVDPSSITAWDNFSGHWDGDAATWASDSESWDEETYTPWDDYSKAWDEFLENPTVYRIIAGTSLASDNRTFVYDFGNLANGAFYQSYLEKRDIAVVGVDRQGQPMVDLSSYKLLTEVWPSVRGNQMLQIFVGAANEVGGVLTWEGPYYFNPSIDKKIDCHVGGRLFAIRFQTFNQVDLKLDAYALHIERVGVY